MKPDLKSFDMWINNVFSAPPRGKKRILKIENPYTGEFEVVSPNELRERLKKHDNQK